MCLWILLYAFVKPFSLPFVYSIKVYINLNRYSLRSNDDFPVLLKASSRIKQPSFYFYSDSLQFVSNYYNLVMDLFTNIRLFLNCSIDVIYFFLSALNALTILGC